MVFKAGTNPPTIEQICDCIGTTISVKKDGVPVFSMTPKDIFYANAIWLNRGVPRVALPTGTNYGIIGITVPFGRAAYPFCLDEELALVAKTGTSLEIEVKDPGDHANVTDRTLSITAITLPGTKPRGFIERIERAMTTVSTWENYITLPYSESNTFLYDTLFYQTTVINDSATADESIDEIALEFQDRPEVLNRIPFQTLNIPTGYLEDRAGTVAAPLTTFPNAVKYGYISFDPYRDLKDLLQLNEPTRYRFKSDKTADAVRLIPGILKLD